MAQTLVAPVTYCTLTLPWPRDVLDNTFIEMTMGVLLHLTVNALKVYDKHRLG